jgi:hydrogenase maturation protein HypF
MIMAGAQLEARSSAGSEGLGHVDGSTRLTVDPELSERVDRSTGLTVEGRRITIQGTVQGVGFRPWVYRVAQCAGITGRVWNDSSGVTIDAFGAEARLERFLDLLHWPPPAARILRFDVADIAAEQATAFEIAHSEVDPERRVSIPPDLATCDDCVSEVLDRSNRRYRYAFTNCTNCGPRFTIATDIPYDRGSTTMAAFEMCDACRREYNDVDDRRFHAQPNACPACGPQLSLRASDGARIHVDDVLAVAARAIDDGLIVAVKGIGGFHLICDATSEDAVRLLRERKRRDEKPFAVMVRTLRDAAALGVVGAEERRLLTSVERPIVLLQKRPGARLAEGVAPCNQMIGVFLPYSPLHHLLLHDARRPLVMTSGNVSDEPMVCDNADAIRRLGGIADLFVLHDRDIHTRCDDSVTTVIAGKGTVLRRARGYVPRAVGIARGFQRPVLACGALLKNTFCIGAGSNAWLGPHIGDLENVETLDAYTRGIELMEQFLGVRAQVIAHDLHPDYLSTAYARKRAGATTIGVQHHHAHVVSAMTEHGIQGSAIGIAYDGTGFGTDGTMWGGEVLVATPARFQRAATFRALPLAGGDQAIREPWRIGLALVLDAFDGDVPAELRTVFGAVAVQELTAVRALLKSSLPTPRARGVGRYFDAFGALFLGRMLASFESQVALEWNQVADPRVTRAYRYGVVTADEYCEIDLRPTVRDAVADRVKGESAATIAAAFHNTIAQATADVVRRAIARFGALPVVASGGCFQNARLAESVQAALAPEHPVLFQREVPPGDGGIALGQAVIADALTRTQNSELRT